MESDFVQSVGVTVRCDARAVRGEDADFETVAKEDARGAVCAHCFAADVGVGEGAVEGVVWRGDWG